MVNPAKQEIFDLHLPSYMGRDDFIVSSCNEAAFKVIDCWPNWLYFATCLYGPKGCGKSHLANLFIEQVMEKSSKIFAVQTIRAEYADLYMPENLFEESPCLIIENMNENINNEAMFHLYNHYRDNNGYLLFLAEKAPAHMNFSLPDLASRMNAVQAIEILHPDDDMLNMLLLKLFSERQLKVSPEVLKYALLNMTRSFDFAQKLVMEADRISLIKKTHISINVIKEAIEYLNDNKQRDFFE